jgi:hypothetical protein
MGGEFIEPADANARSRSASVKSQRTPRIFTPTARDRSDVGWLRICELSPYENNRPSGPIDFIVQFSFINFKDFFRAVSYPIAALCYDKRARYDPTLDRQ